MQSYSQTTINEGFESTNFPPMGWNIYSPYSCIDWVRTKTPTHSGTYSIFLPNWNTSTIVTPMINVFSNQDSLVFWTKYNYDYSPGSIRIYASNTGNTINDIDTTQYIYINTINQSSNGWQRNSIPLGDLIGESVYLHINYNSWRTTMNIDDISIPNNNGSYVFTKRQTNVNQTSASLNGNYYILNDQLTAKGFLWKNEYDNLWDTIYIINDTLKHNLTNLIADNKYEYQAFIQIDTNTLYGTIEYFYTDYLQDSIFPLFESFESNNFPSNGWTNLADSPINEAWVRSSERSKTGSYSAFRDYWNSSWLISPLVKIQDNYDTLSFWYNASSYNYGSPGLLSVYISDSCNFVSCRDLSQLISLTTISSQDGWVNIKTPLIKYNNKKVYIGIKYDSWTWQMYLDDISGILYTGNNSLGVYENIINKRSFDLFPNPANKETRLKVSNIEGKVRIIIKDIQGKAIIEMEENAHDLLDKTIDLRQIPKGQYLISIVNKDIQETKKLIVQ